MKWRNIIQDFLEGNVNVDSAFYLELETNGVIPQGTLRSLLNLRAIIEGLS